QRDGGSCEAVNTGRQESQQPQQPRTSRGHSSQVVCRSYIAEKTCENQKLQGQSVELTTCVFVGLEGRRHARWIATICLHRSSSSKMARKFYLLCCLVLIGLVQNDVIATSETRATPKFREFDLKLFEGLRLGQPDTHNLVFSPASVRTVLAMLRDGAGGETRAHLNHALGETTRSTSLLIPRSLNDGLLVANALFISSRLNANTLYQTRMSSRFGAWVEYSDFSRPRSAADKINEWVRRATKGHITELVNRDTLSTNTVLLIANAVHLHGKWRFPFPAGNTKLHTFYEGFYPTNTSTIQVPTMSQYNYFRAGNVRSLNAKVLELPFQEPEGLSMLLLLPNERGGLVNMLERLQPNSLSSILSALDEPNLVSVTLPRFSAVTAQRLNPILPREVASVFGPEANLTGITQNGEQVQVSQALHKASLSVDEEGAIGSAVSAVTAILLHSGSPFEFHATHPFAYFIVDKRDADAGFVEPVFMGYVTTIDTNAATVAEESGIPLNAQQQGEDQNQQAAAQLPTVRSTTQNPNRIHFGASQPGWQRNNRNNAATP
ncbi:hypothetical protein B566_EDAN005060, partial [Ephemera danica]